MSIMCERTDTMIGQYDFHQEGRLGTSQDPIQPLKGVMWSKKGVLVLPEFRYNH